MKDIIKLLAETYLVCMTITGFSMMGIDKHKAIRKGWRISERTLLLIAFLGGGIGSFLGMHVFRHKTKHRKFVVLLPVAAVIAVAVGLWIYQL
jgi:uncharacterized membrane protein YsdA (DUF1294 family)